MERPDFFELNNGEKVKLPFSDKEYKNRVSKLRDVMSDNNMDICLLYTSPSPRDKRQSRMPSSA